MDPSLIGSQRDESLWGRRPFSEWSDNKVPAVKVNGGDFVFSVKTRQVIDGWVGTVSVDGVEVWTLEAPRSTQDAAYADTKRAVAKAFKNLLDRRD